VNKNRSSLVCLLHSDSGIQLICIAKATGPGLVIKGGANHAEGPMVFIQEIVPGGDSQKDGRLQVGDQLVSINKESLIGVTYEEARSILTRTKLRSKHKITEHLLSKASHTHMHTTTHTYTHIHIHTYTCPCPEVKTNQLIVFLFLFIFLFLLLLLLFLFLLFLFLSVLLSLQGVKLEAEESRALRIRIQLAEEAQKQARGMEMDYEEVIHLLEAEIAELKTQRDEKDELKKKVAVLECQLRKSEAAKKGFELSTGKLLNHKPLKHDAVLPPAAPPYGWEEAFTADGEKYFIK
uniref:PDZ domain-containing protein n=1 Tax=Cyclopterus lumpus TaxID=8103 RepID=A0A8C2X585_CYCLU